MGWAIFRCSHIYWCGIRDVGFLERGILIISSIWRRFVRGNGMTLVDDRCKIWIDNFTMLLVFVRGCVDWMMAMSWLLLNEV